MAVAFDAASNATSSTGPPSSLSWSHTCTGANRLLTVGVHWSSTGGAVSVSSVTYNGVGMTSVGRIDNGDVSTELFRLIAPATGANTIAVTMSGAVLQTLTGGGISYTGVDQTTPLGTWVSATGNSTTPSVTAASAAGNLVVDHVSDSVFTLTVDASQTQRYNQSNDSTLVPGGAGSTEAGATSVTMSWTTTFSIGWAIGAVSVQAAGAAAVADTFTAPPPRPWRRPPWPARKIQLLTNTSGITSFIAQPETGLPYIARPRPGMRPHYPRPAQRLRLFTAPAVQGPAASTETPSAFMARPGRGWRPSSRLAAFRRQLAAATDLEAQVADAPTGFLARPGVGWRIARPTPQHARLLWAQQPEVPQTGIHFVQSQQFFGLPVQNVTMPQLPVLGNLIVVLVASDTGLAANAVTDNQAGGGNTYSRAVNMNTATAEDASIFWGVVTQPITAPFIVEIAGGTLLEGVVIEYAGFTQPPVLDQIASHFDNSGASTTPTTTASPTTTAADELVVAVLGLNVTETTISSPPGYTNRWKELDHSTHPAGAADELVIHTTGAQTATWSLSNASAYNAVLATFKASVEPEPESNLVRPGPLWGRRITAQQFQALLAPASQDRSVPTTPTGLAGVPHEASIDLSWNAAISPDGIAGYDLYRDGLFLITLGVVLVHTDSPLTPATGYLYAIDSFDTLGQHSPLSPQILVTTLAGPTTPTNFQGIPTDTTVALSWSASSSPSGIDHYEVYQGGVLIATPAGLSLLVTGLSPLTPYVFAVDAVDTLGFVSGQATITVTTLQGPPILTSLSPNTGVALETFHLVGSQFGPAATGGTVHFGTVTATINLWTDTDIRTAVPPYTTPGVYQVFVTTPGGTSASLPFTVTNQPIGGTVGFGPPTTGAYLHPRTGGVFKIRSDA